MATGIELAGLTLAAFPLVVNGLTHYVNGLHTYQRWRQFRRELSQYSNAFETQRIWYLDTLELLLDGIIDSKDDLAAMIKHPGHALWHTREYDGRLRTRLDRSFELFFNLLTEVIERLEDFGRRSGLDKKGKVSKSFPAA